MIFRGDIDNWFTHHPPKDAATVEVYQKLREAGRELAYIVLTLVPTGVEQSAALLKVREAVAMANSGIACSGDKS